MKIRADFVTNSSSSSFIMAFKNRGVVADELLEEYTAGRLETILRDCLDKDNVYTKEGILATYREDIEWNVRYYVEDKIIPVKYPNLSWRQIIDWKKEHSSEYEKMVQEEIDKRVSDLEKKLKGMKHIVMVEYEDDCDSALEHEICPNLKCTMVRISHH